MSKHTVAVLLQIETDDPRLDPDKIDVSTAAAAARLRAAVVAALPRDLSRVVLVMPVAAAMIMASLYDRLGEELAGEPVNSYPPDDYVPPTRD